MWCRNRGARGATLAPQYLADQLTLFQPGECRLSPHTYYYWHPQIFSPSGITEFWIYAYFSTSSCQRWIIRSNGPIISSKHVLHRKNSSNRRTHSKFKHKRLYTHWLLEQPRPPTMTTYKPQYNGPKITIKSYYNFYTSSISRDISYVWALDDLLTGRERNLDKSWCELKANLAPYSTSHHPSNYDACKI